VTITVWPADAVSGAPSYTGRKLRQTNAAILAGATAARPLGARSGVRPGTPTNTVTASSTTWTVKPHQGILDLEAAVEASAYWYAIDANVTGSVTAASGSIARVDIVYATLTDLAEDGTAGTPNVTFGYTAGTVAATPPATPARSMVIAYINVPISGGGSPTVSWNAPYTTVVGGVIPVRTQAERDAITFATAEYPVVVDRLDTGALERSVGSGWLSWDTAWQTYTPTLTFGGGTITSLGNAVFSARYFRTGKKIDVQVGYTVGSTTSYGVTGNLEISLPPGYPLAATGSHPYGATLGPGGVFRAGKLGGTAAYHGQVTLTSFLSNLRAYFSVTASSGSPSVALDGYLTNAVISANGDFVMATFSYITA
jgi:hypothetical protein